MAAGLGFKTFTTGEVLTAADTNGYLMQGVLVFASAAARDAAITLPQEGQFAYLKDTNVTTYYTGSAWTNLDTTGMTNPMTTTGDMVYSSSGSTPARLGIGTTGQVVTVAGGVPSWATPSSGSLTKIGTYTFTAAAALNVNNCFSATYKRYRILIKAIATTGTNRCFLKMRVGGVDSSASYFYYLVVGGYAAGSPAGSAGNSLTTGFPLVYPSTTYPTGAAIDMFDPFVATQTVWFGHTESVDYLSGSGGTTQGGGTHLAATSYDGFSLVFASGTFTGEAVVYGYAD